MGLLTLWMSILFGFVQGLTEFLPVSATGHLSVLKNILGSNIREPDFLLMKVFLSLGTLIAIFMVYGRDIKNVISGLVDAAVKTDDMGYRERNGRLTSGARMGVLLIVGALPLILALFLYRTVESLYSNTYFIAFALMVSGAILLVLEKFETGRKNGLNMRISDAGIIGLAQAASMLPGLSRSGATVAAGLACGLKKDFAVKFSVLLSVPAVIGSMAMNFVDAILDGAKLSFVPSYLLGTVFAAAAGYIGLLFLRYIIIKSKTRFVSYYCFVVGLVTLIISFIL